MIVDINDGKSAIPRLYLANCYNSDAFAEHLSQVFRPHNTESQNEETYFNSKPEKTILHTIDARKGSSERKNSLQI